MKACKVNKNIVKIYFLGVVTAVSILGYYSSEASELNVDSNTKILESINFTENESEISQASDLSIQETDILFNPLSFILESQDIEFTQDSHSIDGFQFSNHLNSQDPYIFYLDQTIDFSSFNLETLLFSDSSFVISLVDADDASIVYETLQFDQGLNQSTYNFQDLYTNTVLKFEVQAGSISIQSLNISSNESLELSQEPISHPEQSTTNPSEILETQEEVSEPTTAAETQEESAEPTTELETQEEVAEPTTATEELEAQAQQNSTQATSSPQISTNQESSSANNSGQTSESQPESTNNQTNNNISSSSSEQTTDSSSSSSFSSNLDSFRAQSSTNTHSSQSQPDTSANSTSQTAQASAISPSVKQSTPQHDPVNSQTRSYLSTNQTPATFVSYNDYSNNIQEEILNFKKSTSDNLEPSQISKTPEFDNSSIIIEESEFFMEISDSKVLSSPQPVIPVSSEVFSDQKKPVQDYSSTNKTNTKNLVATNQDSLGGLQVENNVEIKVSPRISNIQTASDQNSFTQSLTASLLVEKSSLNGETSLDNKQNPVLSTHLSGVENRLLKSPVVACKEPICSPLNKFTNLNADALKENNIILDLNPLSENLITNPSFLISGSSHDPNARVELILQRSNNTLEVLSAKLTDSKGDFYFIIDSNLANNTNYTIFAKTKLFKSPSYKLQTSFAKPLPQFSPEKFCGKSLEESRLKCPFDSIPSLEFNLPNNFYLEVLYNSEVTPAVSASDLKVVAEPEQSYLKTLKPDTEHSIVYIVRDKTNPEFSSSPVVVKFQTFLPFFNPVSVPLIVFLVLILTYAIIQSIIFKQPLHEQEVFAQANIDL